MGTWTVAKRYFQKCWQNLNKKENTTSRNRDVLMQTDGTMERIRHLSKTKQGKKKVKKKSSELCFTCWY